jgi:hypothetical protein
VFRVVAHHAATKHKPVLKLTRPPARDPSRRHSLRWQANRVSNRAAKQQAEDSFLGRQLNFHFKARS